MMRVHLDDLLDRRQVAELTGLSEVTVDGYMRDGKHKFATSFPAPIRYFGKTPAWLRSDIKRVDVATAAAAGRAGTATAEQAAVVRCPVCDGERPPAEAAGFFSPAEQERVQHAAWCPKVLYPPGTRVRLRRIADEYTRLDAHQSPTRRAPCRHHRPSTPSPSHAAHGLVRDAGDQWDVLSVPGRPR